MTDAWGAKATYRKMKRQTFDVYLTKGVSVNPKAYCCDDPEGVTAAKPPVAILTATPNPVFAGENVTLDLSQSYDPNGGALTYHIWDGQGADQAGVNWVQGYPNAGRFEAMGVVTDVTGLKGQASTWVEVLSANGDNPPEPPGDWRKKIYLATLVNGIYYTEDFSGPGLGNPEWAQVNTGLGTNNTRCIIGDPWDPAGRQYTRTTEPKIYRRTGGNWSIILDDVIVAARTGEPILGGTLEMIGPKANINAQGHVYALLRYLRAADNRRRLYFFKSINYGANWAFTLITDSGAVPLNPHCLVVGAFQGSSPYAAGQVIYVVFTSNIFSDWGMKVSTNQGGLWGGTIALAHCGVAGQGGDLARSPADQDTIYWAGWGNAPLQYTLRKSTNRGGAFSTLWACALIPTMTQRPGVYIWEPLSAFMAGGSTGLHWTENDWADYVTYTNTDNFDLDGCSRVMDSPEWLYGWQGDNPGGAPAMQHVIAVSDDRGQNWDGKAGDDPVTPSATSVPNNCGGVAGILQVWTED